MFECCAQCQLVVKTIVLYLRDHTRVFRCQFSDLVLFQSMRMNTYVRQFDEKNGVESWTSHEKNADKSQREEDTGTQTATVQNNDTTPGGRGSSHTHTHTHTEE